MVIGTLLEVVHKTGYYSDTMKNVAMASRPSSRLYSALPKMSTDNGSKQKPSMIGKFGPRTGSLADRMQRSRYNTLAKYARSA